MAMKRRQFLMGTVGVAAVAGTGWWAYARWTQASLEAPVLAWMRDRVQRFDATQPDSLAANGALVAALDGAKVIGIGEATHGSHEDVACKAALVRALVQAGAIDTLLLEANGPGCRDLDAFIGGAEGDAVERVKGAAIFRILKTQDMADLMAWLREWNRTAPKRVHVVGIDCQATAQDAAFALDWLATVDATAAADFWSRLAPVVSAEAQALRFPALIASITTAQLRQAMADLDALRVLLGPEGAFATAPGRLDAERAARVAWQGLHAFELEASDGTVEGDAGAYYSRRDVSMAENILEAAGDHGGVYWAHNMHVAGAPMDDYGARIEPTGDHLRRALGEGYKAVLFEYATARFNAVPMSLFEGYPPATNPTEVIEWGYAGGRLAGLFRALGGGDAWIDLAALPAGPELSAWATSEYPMRSPGYAGVHWVHGAGSITIQPRPTIDVLVHIEALSPSRMLV